MIYVNLMNNDALVCCNKTHYMHYVIAEITYKIGFHVEDIFLIASFGVMQKVKKSMEQSTRVCNTKTVKVSHDVQNRLCGTF